MASPPRQPLLLLLLVLCICSWSAARSLNDNTAVDKLSERLRSLQDTLYEEAKRSCDGFPCMYSHLGAKAGRQALMRTLMSIIDNCAGDPMCSPGRRRRKRTSGDLSVNNIQ